MSVRRAFKLGANRQSHSKTEIARLRLPDWLAVINVSGEIYESYWNAICVRVQRGTSYLQLFPCSPTKRTQSFLVTCSVLLNPASMHFFIYLLLLATNSHGFACARHKSVHTVRRNPQREKRCQVIMHQHLSTDINGKSNLCPTPRVCEVMKWGRSTRRTRRLLILMWSSA